MSTNFLNSSGFLGGIGKGWDTPKSRGNSKTLSLL